MTLYEAFREDCRITNLIFQSNSFSPKCRVIFFLLEHSHSLIWYYGPHTIKSQQTTRPLHSPHPYTPYLSAIGENTILNTCSAQKTYLHVSQSFEMMSRLMRLRIFNTIGLGWCTLTSPCFSFSFLFLLFVWVQRGRSERSNEGNLRNLLWVSNLGRSSFDGIFHHTLHP